MKNNKKITAALLILSMALCNLAGCAGSESSGSSDNISDISESDSQPDPGAAADAQSTVKEQSRLTLRDFSHYSGDIEDTE